MFNLIVKDLLYLKKQNLGLLVFTLFIIFITHNSPSLYIASSLLITYLSVTNNNMHDDKNNSQVLLNSLPIRRQDIVLAKYLSIFVYLTIGLLLVFLISIITNIILPSFSMRPITFVDIIGSLAIAMFLFSLYFPLYFKFSMMKILAFLNVSVYLILFATGLYLMIWLKKLYITMYTPDWVLEIAVMILVLAILLLSVVVSLNIYRNKDF